ncbi:hypothetical protein [Hymenobacter sp. B81]|uniref:hypothetical protein n=1 Tax=Hymenobacter sp. B81 TaxID=3344878 RepID=UPI0037DDAD3A
MRALLLLISTSLLASQSAAAEWPAAAAEWPAKVQPAKGTQVDGLIAQPWYRPHHLLGQFAGGQGMVAAGVGYTTLRGRLDVDLLAGYVPKKYSITPMGIFTAKATYSPWTLPLGQSRWEARPLSVGAWVNYTASRGLNPTQGEQYPKGYYWWPAKVRGGGFVGGRVGYQLPARGNGRPRVLSAYYELGSNDLYLVSMWTNVGALSVRDVLTLGFGVKLDL